MYLSQYLRARLPVSQCYKKVSGNVKRRDAETQRQFYGMDVHEEMASALTKSGLFPTPFKRQLR